MLTSRVPVEDNRRTLGPCCVDARARGGVHSGGGGAGGLVGNVGVAGGSSVGVGACICRCHNVLCADMLLKS